MEIAIATCLLIVIFLLVQEKIVCKKRPEQKMAQEKTNPSLPYIMGQPKPIRSLSVPNATDGRQAEQEVNPDNLDIEYDENEIASIQILQEQLDAVLRTTPDLPEEEEEWNRYGLPEGDDSLAQGVTYEELSSIGLLLQKDNLKQAQKDSATAIFQRLQGTELFSLLENSIEGASRKIAELLDSSLSSETDFGSSTLRKNDLSGFDIADFV